MTNNQNKVTYATDTVESTSTDLVGKNERRVYEEVPYTREEIEREIARERELSRRFIADKQFGRISELKFIGRRPAPILVPQEPVEWCPEEVHVPEETESEPGMEWGEQGGLRESDANQSTPLGQDQMEIDTPQEDWATKARPEEGGMAVLTERYIPEGNVYSVQRGNETCCTITQAERFSWDILVMIDLDRRARAQVPYRELIKWPALTTTNEHWGHRCGICDRFISEAYDGRCCLNSYMEARHISESDNNQYEVQALVHRVAKRCELCPTFLGKWQGVVEQGLKSVCCERLRQYRQKRNRAEEQLSDVEYLIVPSQSCRECCNTIVKWRNRFFEGPKRKSKYGMARIQPVRGGVRSPLLPTSGKRAFLWLVELSACIRCLYGDDILTSFESFMRTLSQSYNVAWTTCNLKDATRSPVPPPTETAGYGWVMRGDYGPFVSALLITPGPAIISVGDSAGIWKCDHALPQIILIKGLNHVKMRVSAYPAYPKGAWIYEVRFGCSNACARAILYLRAQSYGISYSKTIVQRVSGFHTKVFKDSGHLIMGKATKQLQLEYMLEWCNANS